MPPQSSSSSAENRVLQPGYAPSSNFFASDKILQFTLKRVLKNDALSFMQRYLNATGQAAAGPMNELSYLADKKSPELVKRNSWGENIDEIRFHPAYWELMEYAVKSGMFSVKWNPETRSRFNGELHRMGFASGYLFAMTELSQFCPLCMTDGVARLIDRYAEEEDKARLLPRIWTDDPSEFFTGAMYLTEKAGGSDVGANLVQANRQTGNTYHLNGEKWFCSNANADLIFALARTNPEVKGTKGLSIFLVEKQLKDGTRNPIDIVRLKDKLGVRSMASAECILTDTVGKLVGDEFSGFKIMADMINLSRLYNTVAAVAGARRAIVEAYQFLSHRKNFGKIALEHALIREKLTELSALHFGNHSLVWRAIIALDKADNGDESEAHLLRLLTPMIKKWTAEKGCYMVRESMELMGGMGYIEDSHMPRIMRDMMVLPIWEGAGNIMTLDMLRALMKSDGLKVMAGEIEAIAQKHPGYAEPMVSELGKLVVGLTQLKTYEQDEMESRAKAYFERLTVIYQLALIIDQLEDESKAWVLPAIHFFNGQLDPSHINFQPLSVEQVQDAMGWAV